MDYADDVALFLHPQNHMQDKTSKLQKNASMLGLKININKTEVMSLNTKEPPVVELDGKQLTCTSSFTYLGSMVTASAEDGADQDIKARLGKAKTAFLRLQNIRKSTNITRNTKIKSYNS